MPHQITAAYFVSHSNTGAIILERVFPSLDFAGGLVNKVAVVVN